MSDTTTEAPPKRRGRPPSSKTKGKQETPTPGFEARYESDTLAGGLGHNNPPPEERTSVQRMSRDLAKAGATLTAAEARFLVDAYYAMQRDRIRADHQYRTLSQGDEPAEVLAWLGDQRGTLEKQVARSLDSYSAGHPVGAWMRSIDGIGPTST